MSQWFIHWGYRGIVKHMLDSVDIFLPSQDWTQATTHQAITQRGQTQETAALDDPLLSRASSIVNIACLCHSFFFFFPSNVCMLLFGKLTHIASRSGAHHTLTSVTFVCCCLVNLHT